MFIKVLDGNRLGGRLDRLQRQPHPQVLAAIRFVSLLERGSVSAEGPESERAMRSMAGRKSVGE